jgi:hypothetical protein
VNHPLLAVAAGWRALLFIALLLGQFLAAAPALAQPPSFAGSWHILKSSWPHVVTLALQQGADGVLSGTLTDGGSSETVSGRAEGDTLVFLRYHGNEAYQVYRGTWNRWSGTLQGDFYGLNGRNSGATAEWNGAIWKGRRAGTGDVRNDPYGANLAASQGPRLISGDHDLYVVPIYNQIASELKLHQQADGSLQGWDRPGYLNLADLVGHYGRNSGTFALLRVRTAPQQVWLGRVSVNASDRASGHMYTLDPAVGPLVREFEGFLRTPDTVAGTWQLNANGHTTDLALSQDAQNVVTGDMFGLRDVTGYYSPGERTLVLLRGDPKRPMQAFVGTLSSDGLKMSGRFHVLDNPVGGGSHARNVYDFAADRTRYAQTPGLPALPMVYGHGDTLRGTYVYPYTGSDPLAPWQDSIYLGNGADALANVQGTMYGQLLQGTFARNVGTLAFVRVPAGGLPLRLYVGRSQLRVNGNGLQADRLIGKSYALTPAAGASPQRMSYDWQALSPDCASGSCQFDSLP